MMSFWGNIAPSKVFSRQTRRVGALGDYLLTRVWVEEAWPTHECLILTRRCPSCLSKSSGDLPDGP